jgi:hypothetical protein
MQMLLMHREDCYFKLTPPCPSSRPFPTDLQISTQLNKRLLPPPLQQQPKKCS